MPPKLGRVSVALVCFFHNYLSVIHTDNAFALYGFNCLRTPIDAHQSTARLTSMRVDSATIGKSM